MNRFGRAAVLAPPSAVDPIARARKQGYGFGMVLVFVAVGIVVHGAFGATIAGATWALGGSYSPATEPEPKPVEIRVIEAPPPEPEIEEVEEPAAEIAPEPEMKIEPVPETRKEKPTEIPKETPPEPEPEPELEPEPEKIVGLNLGSTAPGGSGPKFAGGNSLSGKTKQIAEKPQSIDPEPPAAPENANKVATVVPGSSAKLVKPKRVGKVKPEYPSQLRAQGLEANVVVEVEVAATGKVSSVKILAASQYPEFNTAATAAAKRETFQPATVNGKATSYTISYAYRFRISE